MQKLLTMDDVAELFGVHVITIWRWRKDPQVGFPEGRRIGKKWFWRREEIEGFIG